MFFGKELNNGLVHYWFGVKAVTIVEDGYIIDYVITHDAHCQNSFLHQQLALMDGHDLPWALGVIRDVEALTYNDEVEKQVEAVVAKKNYSCLRDMILDGETWEVK